MRVRRLVGIVLVLDLVVGIALATGGLTGGGAALARQDASPDAGEDPVAEPVDFGAEALKRLGAELAARAAELERRELELDEALRGGEVLRRAGIAPVPVAPAEPATEPEPAETEAEQRLRDSFQRLGRAYENMEPDSAALALNDLAARDKDAVVELLLGWNPRTSGAILDALTQIDSGLAADLSYEIWKRSGKAAAAAANSGRPEA